MVLGPKRRQSIVLEAVTKEMTSGLGWKGPSKRYLQSGENRMSKGGSGIHRVCLIAGIDLAARVRRGTIQARSPHEGKGRADWLIKATYSKVPA